LVGKCRPKRAKINSPSSLGRKGLGDGGAFAAVKRYFVKKAGQKVWVRISSLGGAGRGLFRQGEKTPAACNCHVELFSTKLFGWFDVIIVEEKRVRRP
jgi:hypothetical protein